VLLNVYIWCNCLGAWRHELPSTLVDQEDLFDVSILA
jgi:hypothetical protein